MYLMKIDRKKSFESIKNSTSYPLKLQTKYLIKFHNPWSVHHISSYAITLIRFAKFLQLNQSGFIDTQTNAKYLQIRLSLDCVHIFRVMPSSVIEQSQLGQK